MFRVFNFAQRAAVRPVVRQPGLAIVRSFSKLNISDVFVNEITEEKANDEIDQEFLDIKAQILKSFKVVDTPGNGVVQLTRTLKGENIEVYFDCQDEEELEPEYDETADAEEEMEMGLGINFDVTLTNSTGKIVANCLADEGLTIRNIQFIPTGRDVEDKKIYGGPAFDTLSDDLQDAWAEFLAARGIDEDFSLFVIKYAQSKERTEYIHWMENMLAFTSKK